MQIIMPPHHIVQTVKFWGSKHHLLRTLIMPPHPPPLIIMQRKPTYRATVFRPEHNLTSTLGGAIVLNDILREVFYVNVWFILHFILWAGTSK